MERTNDRPLPPDYSGPVDIWDIDKTYLLTEFERLRDLVRGAIELAIDKRARPGAAALLRALRRGPGMTSARTPLYFVSASPPELRRVIEGKMLLDGVEWDGIAFKDQLALVRSGRFREVRRHVAYKLSALLAYRAEWPAGAREWLFGDDAESDPDVFTTYARIRAGELRGLALEKELARLEVVRRDRRAIRELEAFAARHSPAPPGGSVEAIYVFRAAREPRKDLEEDYPLVTQVADAAALARLLFGRGRIAASALAEVEREMSSGAEGG
jgi:hypothetical protein